MLLLFPVLIAEQLDKSTKAIHSLRVLHTDLELRNMLWDEHRQQLMLIDFERAQVHQPRRILGDIPPNQKSTTEANTNEAKASRNGSPDTPGSSQVNDGTVKVRLAPYTEHSIAEDSRRRQLDEYQTISAQQECAGFSLEELRLADYEQGHATSDGQRHVESAILSTRSLQRLPRTDDKTYGSHLALLIGPAIEIRVGTATSARGPVDSCVSWSLPKRLISHHSPFLAAACDRDFKERRENLIELPDDDPTVFALFVEWLYYGAYAIEPLSLPSNAGNDGVSVDAECWVLGDKLLCSNFKSYAMRRLYKQHTAKIFSRSITTDDVQFACDHSAQDSKLRELYSDPINPYLSIIPQQSWSLRR
ncbi:hypothetical protein E8E12_000865 [Didymella heteroderae]|uniref:BTB domain-containing protein n=1 Tax=Didymella heteroderae TaxID=1769908 RepID=A0A9P4WFP1_9PLEO|nr:hypothetical protein E8E12_000865 [Didymella heteroderae]